MSLSISYDPVQIFPRDISFEIFSYLNKVDLARSSQVNKEWYDLSNDNRLWGKFIKRELPEKFSIKNLLKNVKFREALSNDIFVKRVQNFVKKVGLGHKGKFTCILSKDPNYNAISIEIEDVRTKKRKKCLIQRSCYLLTQIGEGTLEDRDATISHSDHLDYSLERHLTKENRIFKARILSFKAIATFPLFHMRDFIHISDVEKKICNILIRRLDELVNLESHRYSKYYHSFAVGVIVLSALTMQFFFSNNK